MEGLSVDAIPEGQEWQYEPMWAASVASHFAMRKTWSLNQSRSNRWRDIFRRSWEKNWGLLL
jgi:hypothetical protein